MIEHETVPGIGRVGTITGKKARLDYFESVAEFVVHSRNSEVDYWEPDKLHVGWDRPFSNLVDSLVVWGNESSYFHCARFLMLGSFIAQHAACGNADGLPFPVVDVFHHQVYAALTVISDPGLAESSREEGRDGEVGSYCSCEIDN